MTDWLYIYTNRVFQSKADVAELLVTIASLNRQIQSVHHAIPDLENLVNAYKLAIAEKPGKEGEFTAHLFKLKQEYFLDLLPRECNYATNQADLVAFSMIPGHLLVRVPQIEPELKLAFFNFDWLCQQLTNHPSLLAHHRENDRFVLTAGTRDLQRFVLKHLAEGELFKTPDEMVRQAKPAER